MKTKRMMRRESFTYWLLVLGVFGLNELQAEENKTSLAQDPTHVDKSPEESKTLQESHTIQLFADCELNDDIEIGNHTKFAMDGEDFIKIDDQTNHWTIMKPEAERFKSLAESYFGVKMREKSMKKYCYEMMRKILQYSNMNENVAPEVTVSRHDAPDGGITFNCIATGFYPHSIQLRCEKVPEKPSVKRPWEMALGLLIVIMLVLGCAGAFIIWKKKKTGHRTHEQATVDGNGNL